MSASASLTWHLLGKCHYEVDDWGYKRGQVLKHLAAVSFERLLRGQQVVAALQLGDL